MYFMLVTHIKLNVPSEGPQSLPDVKNDDGLKTAAFCSAPLVIEEPLNRTSSSGPRLKSWDQTAQHAELCYIRSEISFKFKTHHLSITPDSYTDA